jgi:hypothetical protein
MKKKLLNQLLMNLLMKKKKLNQFSYFIGQLAKPNALGVNGCPDKIINNIKI